MYSYFIMGSNISMIPKDAVWCPYLRSGFVKKYVYLQSNVFLKQQSTQIAQNIIENWSNYNINRFIFIQLNNRHIDIVILMSLKQSVFKIAINQDRPKFNKLQRTYCISRSSILIQGNNMKRHLLIKGSNFSKLTEFELVPSVV